MILLSSFYTFLMMSLGQPEVKANVEFELHNKNGLYVMVATLDADALSNNLDNYCEELTYQCIQSYVVNHIDFLFDGNDVGVEYRSGRKDDEKIYLLFRLHYPYQEIKHVYIKNTCFLNSTKGQRSKVKLFFNETQKLVAFDSEHPNRVIDYP